jgi:rubrerythrin
MDSHSVPNRDTSAGHESGRTLDKLLKKLSESAEALSAGPFTSVKDVLDYAIAREKESYDFYQVLIALAKKPEVRRAFGAFASDELQHAARLRKFRSGEFSFEPELVGSLGIADKAHPVRIHRDMSYTDALVVAMRKEKTAFRLYTKLAALSGDTEIKEMFSLLAQEEAKHKLSLEVEYDLTTF